MRTGQYGGAEKHLLELLLTCSGSGFEISLLCLGTDFYSDALRRNHSDVTVKCIPDVTGFRAWWQLLRTHRVDVIVFVRAWLWCFPWYVPVIAGLVGIPRRFGIAHLIPPDKPPAISGWSLPAMVRRIRRHAHLASLWVSARFYTATICVSSAIRDALRQDYGFPADRTITIHNGVSLSGFDRGRASAAPDLRTRVGAGPMDCLVVCVARLVENKGIDVLLLALARVLRGGVSCKCVVVGDGPLRQQLSDQTEALGLTGHVFFAGFQENVRPYLEVADAFVLTSHKEGLPLAILEAMACGLPCVVTSVGGNAEAVEHRVHGLVVPPGSPGEVAEALSWLIAHPEERAQMSRRARQRVCQAFDTRDRMAEIRHVLLTCEGLLPATENAVQFAKQSVVTCDPDELPANRYRR